MGTLVCVRGTCLNASFVIANLEFSFGELIKIADSIAPFFLVQCGPQCLVHSDVLWSDTIPTYTTRGSLRLFAKELHKFDIF